jgi:hypothetical protein
MAYPAPVPDLPVARLIRGLARYACGAAALICFGLLLLPYSLFWFNLADGYESTEGVEFLWGMTAPVLGCLGTMFMLMGVVFTDQFRNRAGWRMVPLILGLLIALFLLAMRWQRP